MQPKFRFGERVRFLADTYVLETSGKCKEYELRGLTGVVIGNLVGNKYLVEVVKDDVTLQFSVGENEIEKCRIATPLGDKIEQILKDYPYITDFEIDGKGNYHWSFAKTPREVNISSLMCRLNALGEAFVKLAESELDRVKVREALSFGPIELPHFIPHGICLDPEHRGKIVFKKEDDKKVMSKEKCISLLERYRAERDKIEKGRRFELRLRNSVVNEAIERAIALLKSGE